MTHFFIFDYDKIPKPFSSSPGFNEVIRNFSTEKLQYPALTNIGSE